MTANTRRIVLATMAAAAGIITLSGPASAATTYFGDTVTFREAKRMCDGMHGRVFLSSRDVYGCQAERARRSKYVTPPPPPPPGDNVPEIFSIQKTSDGGKRQNFGSREDFGGRTGGGNGGSGGGNGGGGNGGSAGGPY